MDAHRPSAALTATVASWPDAPDRPALLEAGPRSSSSTTTWTCSRRRRSLWRPTVSHGDLDWREHSL